jgi:hypothetical protein
MITVKNIMDFIAESKVTKRNCEICNKEFNPQHKDTYISVCSFECATIKFTQNAQKEQNQCKTK